LLAKRLPAPERRRQIAATALEILATDGVRGLTARAIAERVGVKDGSLFRHFASKEAIVDAAIDAFEGLMGETFPDPGGDPLRALSELFQRRVALARARPELLRLALSDRLTEVAGAEGAARVQAVVERSVTFVREQLTLARRQGRVRDDVPVEILVWTVTGVLRGAAGASHAPSLRRRAARFDPAAAWRSLELLLTTRTDGSNDQTH
jgi:AcrR family transcriptional regulator